MKLIKEIYHHLQNEFIKQKQQKLNDSNYPSNEQRLEQLKQSMKCLDEIVNQLKELIRIQRLLTSKGHRIDYRTINELNTNLKTLDGHIHNEIERIERILQVENDFYRLEKELDSHLQLSFEQLNSSQYRQDKTIIYQVYLFFCIN